MIRFSHPLNFLSREKYRKIEYRILNDEDILYSFISTGLLLNTLITLKISPKKRRPLRLPVDLAWGLDDYDASPMYVKFPTCHLLPVSDFVFFEG